MSEETNKNDSDDDVVGKKSFFSGGFAQLIVFANGLILTVAAYLILNFYLSDMLKDEIRQTKLETEQNIVRNLGEMEQTIKTVSTLVKLSRDTGEQNLRRQIYYAVGNPELFDRIVFMDMAMDGSWDVREIHSNPEYKGKFLPSINNDNFSKDIVAATKNFNGRSEMFFLADYPGRQDFNISIDPYVVVSPIIIGKSLDKNAPEQGVVLGITSSEHILGEEWLAENGNLSHIILRSEKASSPCLYMMKKRDASRFDCAFEAGSDFMEIPVADEVIALQATAEIGESGAVLAKVPLLMLIFGALLTMLGTMYVRNNQRQSYRLTEINRRLAQKNYDLNTEIAERERLNYTLRKAEREYRATINGVTDIIFEVSTDGEIIFMNETWYRVTGFKTSQVIGRSLFDLLQQGDQEEQRAMFEEMVRGQRHAYKAPTKLRTSEGAYRSVEIAFSMIRQDESNNLRVLGSFMDIEDRKRAEDALSEAEKKYRTIWENAAGGIYQVSPEGRFLTANPSLARIFEYETPEQMIRQVRNAHEYLYSYPQERAKFLRELETVGFVTNFETQAKTKSGHSIWISESARAVKDDDGNILYFEGSVEDITRRKEGEIKLREAKVQSDLANRAKSEFLANMSHELRTPLNAIIGFSEIIKKEVLGPVQPKEYVEYSNDIYESGKRLLKIINEILDVSRIETGNRNLNESQISIERIANACVDFMRPKAELTEIIITNMVDEDIPDVIGEEIAVKQIILNLLSNAVKFTPEKGRVTISYEVDRDGQLRLSISDTGVGIEDSQIEKALSPFGQVDTSFNRTASGAGLGLTLVNSLIQLHGGTLELFSQKGLGTTATIVFPSRRVSFSEGMSVRVLPDSSLPQDIVPDADEEISEALKSGDRREKDRRKAQEEAENKAAAMVEEAEDEEEERRSGEDRREAEADLRYLKSKNEDLQGDGKDKNGSKDAQSDEARDNLQ